MQMNCIDCAVPTLHRGRRNERTRPAHDIPHAAQHRRACRAIAQRRWDASRIMNKENKTRSMIKRNFYKSLTRQKPTKQKTMTTKSTNIKHLLKAAQGAGARFKKNLTPRDHHLFKN
jgi:hypothetical protein